MSREFWRFESKVIYFLFDEYRYFTFEYKRAYEPLLQHEAITQVNKVEGPVSVRKNNDLMILGKGKRHNYYNKQRPRALPREFKEYLAELPTWNMTRYILQKELNYRVKSSKSFDLNGRTRSIKLPTQ